jgi:hypothetical protein
MVEEGFEPRISRMDTDGWEVRAVEGGAGGVQSLLGCVIMRAVTPGIAMRHPGLLIGRPYGTGLASVNSLGV